MDKIEDLAKIKHLCNRAGFGISYAEAHSLSKKKISNAVDQLLKKHSSAVDLTTLTFEDFKLQQLNQANLSGKKDLTPEQKIMRSRLMIEQNQVSRRLNVEWMQQMIHTNSPLLEKMTLFWHGHFACRANNPFFAQQLNNIQRTHALGNFKTLLIEVSKSPAMLQYLNNQQNRKGRPNENFARELMELFTIGRGNYTENDVKESARSFTGWTYDKDANFQFNLKIHDEKDKTFFGQTGPFQGEDIIDIILKNPATATFICRKLYVFFVNDIPNESHIKEIAAHFYEQHYEIEAVLRKLFTAPWFYAKENLGNKIKSPIELLAGLSREFYISYRRPQVLTQLQSSLGQHLFNPPNVAGWPGGKNWIDSSSLMLRMKIPSLILNNGTLDFGVKPDPEDEALIALNRKATLKPFKSNIDTEVNWDKFLKELPKNIQKKELAAFLLAPALSKNVEEVIDLNTSLKNTAIAVTSMPEYQLC